MNAYFNFLKECLEAGVTEQNSTAVAFSKSFVSWLIKHSTKTSSSGTSGADVRQDL